MLFSGRAAGARTMYVVVAVFGGKLLFFGPSREGRGGARGGGVGIARW